MVPYKITFIVQKNVLAPSSGLNSKPRNKRPHPACFLLVSFGAYISNPKINAVHSSKLRWASIGLHDIMSQKIILFSLSRDNIESNSELLRIWTVNRRQHKFLIYAMWEARKWKVYSVLRVKLVTLFLSIPEYFVLEAQIFKLPYVWLLKIL